MTELKPCPFCGLEIQKIAMFGDTSSKRIGVHPPSVSCILANVSIVAEKWDGWNTRIQDNPHVQ